MQFELTHNVRQNIVYVKFSFNSFKIPVIQSFENSFARIGGKFQPEYGDFKFPIFITSVIISEIIHNTCFVCGGLMTNSTAFQNTLVSFNDFGNDSESRGTTQSRVGTPKQINVRKCSECGHSHT